MTKFEKTFTFLAFAISVIAVTYAAIDSHNGRKHNKFSVRPILMPQADISIKSDELGIKIVNKGVGPAIINDFGLFIDDQIVKKGTLPESYIHALKILDINASWIHCAEIPSVISPGEEVFLISHRKEDSSHERYHKFMNAISRLSFGIKYSSIYNENFSLLITPPQLPKEYLTGVPPTWPKEPKN